MDDRQKSRPERDYGNIPRGLAVPGGTKVGGELKRGSIAGSSPATDWPVGSFCDTWPGRLHANLGKVCAWH